MNVQVYESVLQEDCGYYSVDPNPSSPSSSPSSCLLLIGAIDQGTSSTRFLVLTHKGRIAASAQVEHKQIYPPSAAAGWHEHDPLELFVNTKACIQAVGSALKNRCGIDLTNPNTRLQALGITNQRETTIAWNRVTGIPYYNAIVWDDTRTQGIAEHVSQGNPDRLRDQTGLPVAAYFAGTKVKWLLDHVQALRDDVADPVEQANVCFGTVDSWLIYQLTGQPATGRSTSTTTTTNQGGRFCTDVTNASRWLFLDIHTMQWDQSLVDQVCAPHCLPISCLPQVCPSSHIFGVCRADNGISYLNNVPIAGVLGDQQAALFGQTAFAPGEAKNTYGTGLFLMMNTGTKAAKSQRLLTTVAYQLGSDQPVHYALEGSVSHSGSTIQWLRDQLQIIPSAPDSEAVATIRNDGLYFVPAFCGLFAPHWRSDARACLVGLTTSHHKGHVCRAALEATAYQTREVFDAIQTDAAVQLLSLKVDGGGTTNNLLMQFQADMLQVPVVKPVIQETTSLGVAFCAGLAVGVWNDLDEIKQLWAVSRIYHPRMSEPERHHNWRGWTKAVSRSLGWVDVEKNHNNNNDDKGVLPREEVTLPAPPPPPPSPQASTMEQRPQQPTLEVIGTRVMTPASSTVEEDGDNSMSSEKQISYKNCCSCCDAMVEDAAPLVVEGRILVLNSTTTISSVGGTCTILCSAALGLAVGAFLGAGGLRGRKL
ncbi:hypothetical protein ACA910_007466 [Epithemia clementina (nom. ined.)]